ncbi:MAG: molybdopterin-dependent oxidoreductase [Candidatus Thiodiazotropha sp. (ex Monitilora ramsayi)]|nr:molybdopterin-dependent oxidoreductase [Candidatus Thiodiazotropha sp. (ex Monitilora ramsayi)]
MSDWTRRNFLKATVAALGSTATSNAFGLFFLEPVDDPLGAYPYRGWEDFYRDQFTWDSTGRTTHGINCTGSCSWKGYVKNGILFKEEQYADFPAISDQLPSYNPRGCQKGANYKEYIYGPQRVKYPLMRVGARGEGKWRRATWGEVFNAIADQMVETITHSGPDAITFFSAIPAKHHLTLAGGFRFANLIGGVVCSFYDWYCDLPPGEPMTWGVQTDSCESADWFNSDYLIMWGSNVVETRIPDAHFYTEARMKGTKIVSIHPEYNPSTIHADLHVHVTPGTDGHLALAMSHVIVLEALYDAAYLRQFTDMPMLVRNDNNKLLRESDVVAGGSDQKFYFWDNMTQQAVLAPGTLGEKPAGPQPTSGQGSWTLDLGNVDPALEGNYTVATLSGNVMVLPVFERLRDSLADYSPVAMQSVTGVQADIIAQVAREFAVAAPRARVIEGAGTNHYYHNDLINRAQMLLPALCGCVGHPGGGFDHYVGQEKLWAEEGFFEFAFPLSRARQRFQNTTLWTYIHGDVASDVDDLWPKDVGEYIVESVNNGWMPVWPKGNITYDPLSRTVNNDRSPEVLFVWGANYLNQAKGNMDVLANLYPKLKLIVDINSRMDTTALYADIVLPAASWYEQWNLSTTDLHTFVHPFTPVIPQQFDSRTDWRIWKGLARVLGRRGLIYNDTVPNGDTITRDLTTLFDDLTTGAHGENIRGDRAACQHLLDLSPETNGLTIRKRRSANSIIKHPQRFLQASRDWTSDIVDGEAYSTFRRMTENLRPLTTLVGRQQFYIDQDWFLDFGEQLPVAKGPINVDDYPLRWLTPHGRWSIHSTWRDAKFQLRLQRGRPVVYLSPPEAAQRGLADNELVEVFNGHGSFEAHLNIAPRLPDNVAMMYHGWEHYFLNNGWQTPVTIRIKPTEIVGGYGQLKFRLNYWGPTGNQRDTRVEIRRAGGNA